MFELEQLSTNKALAWLAIALLISVVVRALKPPSPFPDRLHVPPRVRPWLAVALGQLAAIADAIAVGTPWRTAALHGLAAAATAVLGHETVVKGILKGRASGTGPVSGGQGGSKGGGDLVN